MGNLIRCITSDGFVSAVAINSTNIIYRAERIHRSSAVVTAALGRLLTAASLIGSSIKDENGSVTLRIKGDGPVEALIAVSDSEGNVRGYPVNPIVEIPLNKNGKLDVGACVGQGTLFISKDIGEKEPYNGTVELISGEIAEDITAYFAQSEQIPTVCALGVLVNPDLTVKAAGGYLIQLLPAAGEEEIKKIEKGINAIPSITQMLTNGMDILDIVKLALSEFEVEVLSESDVIYKCNCTRERVKKALISIGKSDFQKIIDEQGKTEVDCHFCEKRYKFNKLELEKLVSKI